MTTMPLRITAGVDTHLDVHVAAALDERGGLLGVESFPTTPEGYQALLGWLRGFGEVGLANQLWHRDHPEITNAIAERTNQLRQLETQPASASGGGQDQRDRDRHAERSSVFGDLDAALTDLTAITEALEQQPPRRPAAVEPPAPHIDPPGPDVGLGL